MITDIVVGIIVALFVAYCVCVIVSELIKFPDVCNPEWMPYHDVVVSIPTWLIYTPTDTHTEGMR